MRVLFLMMTESPVPHPLGSAGVSQILQILFLLLHLACCGSVGKDARLPPASSGSIIDKPLFGQLLSIFLHVALINL